MKSKTLQYRLGILYKGLVKTLPEEFKVTIELAKHEFEFGNVINIHDIKTNREFIITYSTPEKNFKMIECYVTCIPVIGCQNIRRVLIEHSKI